MNIDILIRWGLNTLVFVLEESLKAKSGFTGLLLSIAAMVSTTTKDVVEEALKTFRTKEIDAWCKINIGQSIQSMRKEAFSSLQFHTIKEMEVRSLAGSYDITIVLSVNGQKVLASVIPINLYSGEVRHITPAPTPTPEPSPVIAAAPTGKNVTIFVNNDRYYPSNLTIDAGDMVIWVNTT